MAVFGRLMLQQEEQTRILKQSEDTLNRINMLQNSSHMGTTSYGLMYISQKNSRCYCRSKNIFTTKDTGMIQDIKKCIDWIIHEKIDELDTVKLDYYKYIEERQPYINIMTCYMFINDYSYFSDVTLVYYEVKDINPELLNWAILDNMPLAKKIFVIEDGILNKNIDNIIAGPYYKHLVNEISKYNNELINKSKKQLRLLCNIYNLNDRISWVSFKKRIYKILLDYFITKLKNDYWLFYNK